MDKGEITSVRFLSILRTLQIVSSKNCKLRANKILFLELCFTMFLYIHSRLHPERHYSLGGKKCLQGCKIYKLF